MVKVATLKAHAEELIAKAIAGEATVIEQDGKRAVLLPYHGVAPDFELEVTIQVGTARRAVRAASSGAMHPGRLGEASLPE